MVTTSDLRETSTLSGPLFFIHVTASPRTPADGTLSVAARNEVWPYRVRLSISTALRRAQRPAAGQRRAATPGRERIDGSGLPVCCEPTNWRIVLDRSSTTSEVAVTHCGKT